MSERAEPVSVLREAVVARLVHELRSALKRKPAREAWLGGAVRTLFLHAPELEHELVSALELLVRRGSFDRPLYGAIARGLAEAQAPEAAPLLALALAAEEGGGLATLSAAGLTGDSPLAEPLAKLAGNRHAHVAFAAEVARVARGESNGAHASAIAPMIKEVHRIALCEDVLVPWVFRESLARGIGAGLAALRGAERHLGRWLLLAELGARAGDDSVREEAKHQAAIGPAGTRPAWTFVSFALDPGQREPSVRPNLELVTRLSDRPTADKDLSFLYRLAAARVENARPLLRHLTRGPLENESAIRAALSLAREFEDARARTQLEHVVENGRHEALRGLAAAALFDLGAHERAVMAAGELAESSKLPTLTFANLVLLAASGKESGPLVTEPRVRRIQLGWVP
jgi:hypothetical protein